jgi:putative toxin-antitoxin system antitoxin component (TIGR02293 family)
MNELPTLIEAVYQKLGGKPVLGREILSDAELEDVVSHGIPLDALVAVRHAGFSDSEISRLVIPARTRRHREARKETLTIEESDRLVRLARIQAVAEDVFGNSAKANRWLRQGLGILGGRTPLELAKTEVGARIIEQLLGKIAWGAAA